VKTACCHEAIADADAVVYPTCKEPNHNLAAMSVDSISKPSRNQSPVDF